MTGVPGQLEGVGSRSAKLCATVKTVAAVVLDAVIDDSLMLVALLHKPRVTFVLVMVAKAVRYCAIAQGRRLIVVILT